MWAFLVLAFALTAGALETKNRAIEEKTAIARGKLLVSTDKH